MAKGNLPILREAYKNKFLIGTILGFDVLQGGAPLKLQIAQKYFNALTPENSLKPASVEPREGQFTFAEGDRLVEIARQTGACPIGHVLVWHGQTPQWFFEGQNGKPMSRELALQRMRNYIHAVVGHYRGRIKQWDVVNEAIDDGPGLLRDTPWRRAIGDDFIEQAFRAAHEADPAAILIYNDYNIDMPYKRPKAIELLKSLLAKKVPIHAVGIQGHWHLDTNLDEVEKSIEQFSALGLKVMITELDVGVLPSNYRGADISHHEKMTEEQRASMNPYTAGLPEKVAQEQAEFYRRAFSMFLRHQKAIGRVTFWGTHDGDSWLNGFPVPGRTDYPLLFDRSGNPKPAYEAVAKLGRGLP
jgi:endo-1,4-beta-xylanase